jgi:hypothetical protein
VKAIGDRAADSTRGTEYGDGLAIEVHLHGCDSLGLKVWAWTEQSAEIALFRVRLRLTVKR